MSAMRSASSRTTTSISATDTAPRSVEVDQPARGGDDDVDALAELLDLALDVGAAVDDDDAQAAVDLPRGSSTSATWTASSRVGTSTRARGRLGAAGRRPA